ncbi:unnamed protein product [Didymodactylos carnosus]|uniref:Transposase n=1 Tax=Didymodactylos carnosus TaxID=1234261 RepID=A0A8S2RI68_9BILA|nr:unnamed protein product [Didymodactylos carnosus]CAF4165317.1 unnamed protein product [Didymodactylos carnosus]
MIAETGSIVLSTSPGRPRIIRTKNMIQKVKNRLKRKKRVPTRKLASELKISRRSVQRILKNDLGLTSYKKRIEPLPTDTQKAKRITFGNWVRHNFSKEQSLRILSSDEKMFDLNGMYNCQNDQAWAVNRAEADKNGGVKQKQEFPQKVMVWLGVCSEGVTPLVIWIMAQPRHPLSQGCIERANDVLSIALGKRLDTNNSVHWSDGLLPVVYGINTRVSSTTKTTLYEIMFGQRPRSDFDFWKIVKECDIMDEEQLPTPIERADVFVDEIVEQFTINETVINDFDKQKENDNLSIDNFIPEMFPLLNTNNDPNAAGVLYHSLLELSPSSSYGPNHQPLVATINSTTENVISFDSPPAPPQPSSQSSASSALTSNSLIINSPRHNDVRHRAAENYLGTANKKRKAYDEHLCKLAEQYKKGDYLGVRIHEVDRTNTHPKILPCILVAKEKKDNDFIVHLCCQHGLLQNKFSIESIIDLRSTCPDEL